MPRYHVDYDRIAPAYDLRYTTPYRHQGRSKELLALVAQLKATHVLEAGCGTGHWLSALHLHATVDV